jgi:hypothetical protein
MCSASAQHARAERVERFEQAVTVVAETGHFARPQVRRHDVRVFRVARDLAADVPELLEIRVFRILRGFDAERRVAARRRRP